MRTGGFPIPTMPTIYTRVPERVHRNWMADEGFDGDFGAGTKDSSKGQFLQNDFLLLHPSFPPPQKNIFPLPTLNIIHHLHFMKTFIMEGSSRFFFEKRTEGFFRVFWNFGKLVPGKSQLLHQPAVLLLPLWELRSRLKREVGWTSTAGNWALRVSFFFVVEVFFWLHFHSS